MPSFDRLILYFDGASRNNPRGPAGCGWCLYEMDGNGADSSFVARGRKYLGYDISNNQAEYEGLEEGLSYINNNWISCDGLYIRGDSQIVIKQMEGIYEVRSPNIRPYCNAVQSQTQETNANFIRFSHISRSQNSEADNLANEAIDDQSG